MKNSEKILIHASELLTGQGIAAKGGRHPREEDLGRIDDGAIVYIPGGKIIWVGKTKDLPKKYIRKKKTDLKLKKAVMPGLIDCHTHLVFAGNRANEFAERCGGASYEEIARRGGGILSTVRATREASLAQLERLATERVMEARALGVRTMEIKSGYGLSVEAEIKLLEVVANLKRKFNKKFKDMTFCSTFLGAHAFPPAEEGSREEYLSALTDKMLPMVAKKKLATACDIFIDRGYFTLDDAKKVLARARELGLDLKIHGDELTDTGSAVFGAQIGVLSVDHLLHISDEGVGALAKSDTVAVLLPGTAFFLKEQYAPARKLIEAGVCVAISTDFNPGSSMCNHLPLIMTISALYMKMSRAEIFAGVTYNAAKALGLEKKKGVLARGRDADVIILPFESFDEMYYRLGWSS